MYQWLSSAANCVRVLSSSSLFVGRCLPYVVSTMLSDEDSVVNMTEPETEVDAFEVK